MGKLLRGVWLELSLYTRQVAWLQTAPNKREHELKQDSTPNPTRLKKLIDDGLDPEFPWVELGYMIDYLNEVGPVMDNGFGQAPLTFQEIESWERKTGIRLNPWEAKTLRDLSVEYLNQVAISTDPDCDPPYHSGDEDEEPRRERVAGNFMAFIGASRVLQDNRKKG